MSSDLLPVKVSKSRVALQADRLNTTLGLKIFDSVLLLAFLALTFLLGAFAFKDTDFWWHLKAGDSIRQSGHIPTVDTYTFSVEGTPWIDLHWLFQVAISWLYESGGVPALTLAKCAVTTIAVLLLVTAKKREWPMWAVLLAWLPALLVLSGRMYVRPETLTLLYLSAYLAVLTRIERYPWLTYVLPFVQVAWVNTQGLFVFGPIFYVFALIDALLRPNSLAKSNMRWWKTVLGAGAFIGLACLINPYGLTGALYPLQLAGTMNNPVFTNSIAELTPIPRFLAREGLTSVPFRLQLLTLMLGALSFILPIVWLVLQRIRKRESVGTTVSAKLPKAELVSAKGAKVSKRATRAKSKVTEPPPTLWRLSIFRLLLFLALTRLSWLATRNSHQFAAVVGALTAWNFGEWAYAWNRTRLERPNDHESPATTIVPRLVSLGAIVAVLIWVASGSFYVISGEGRTIALGEEPLWFPKEAIKFAGSEGMPNRFVGFHIGHNSLFEYEHAPARKVFIDPRLEIMGPDLYERYSNLQYRFKVNDTSWASELDAMERPSVLADHENAEVSGALYGHPDWRCVWFDPIVSLFVHKSYPSIVEKHEVDFGARHFKPTPAIDPSGTAALFAMTKGIRSFVANVVRQGPAMGRPLVLLGLDYARRLNEIDSESPEGWKLIGQLEMMRESNWIKPIPRFQFPFDPIFDLSKIRDTYAFKSALERAPDDFLGLFLLSNTFESRVMNEAVLPLLDKIIAFTPINPLQREGINKSIVLREQLVSELGPLQTPPPRQNLKERTEVVNNLLAHGRVETAAVYLEKATPADSRTWEEADRIATLWLHLGNPAKARNLWRGVANSPTPGLKSSRIAVTYLTEGDYPRAREAYQIAVAAEPTLFEAQYGLAVLEQDAGRASAALAAGRKAATLAPNEIARSVAQALVAFVTPYANSPIASKAEQRPVRSGNSD